MGASQIAAPPTNLQIQASSRSELERGDIFVAALPDEQYLFGRVVAPDLILGDIEGIALLYFYAGVASTKDLPADDTLQTSNLLLPPLLTNRLLWARGYFETIGNKPFAEGEELERHAFRTIRGIHVDECGNTMIDLPDVIGNYELASYRVIDDKISDVLGLERAER